MTRICGFHVLMNLKHLKTLNTAK